MLRPHRAVRYLILRWGRAAMACHGPRQPYAGYLPCFTSGSKAIGAASVRSMLWMSARSVGFLYKDDGRVIPVNMPRAGRSTADLRQRAFSSYLSPVPNLSHSPDPWVRGVYLIPDAVRILRIPAESLRGWVGGRNYKELTRFPAGPMESEGSGRDRHFGFLTLVELFTIAELRRMKVPMAAVRDARDELAKRFKTDHPFALGGLLCSGKKLLKELGDGVLLELGAKGQTAFEKIVEPFCARLDFDEATSLARRFHPLGKDVPVVVDPRHAFGRPTIEGTNVTTEAIMSLVRGGEAVEDIAEYLSITPEAVKAAKTFETSKAA